MIRYYCICGAYAKASDNRSPALKWFKHKHKGPGHEPCSAETAARARRREDAKAAQEDWKEKS